jgi:hypothetical protein
VRLGIDLKEDVEESNFQAETKVERVFLEVFLSFFP